MTQMLSKLDDAATLAQRAKRELVVAAAFCGATLSPIVVLVSIGIVEPGQGPIGWMLAFFVGWSALLGAMLATVAVRGALRKRTGLPGGSILGWSVLCGVVYPVGLFAPTGLLSLPSRDLPEMFVVVLFGPIIVTCLGAVFSVPAGLAFGGIFWAGIAPMRARLEAPAHDLVARAKLCGAAMLLAATGVAVALAAFLEGAYCFSLFFVILPALGIVPPEGTDAAWTRFVVLPAPLFIALVVVGVSALIERARVARTARAIAAGTHPFWVTDVGVDVRTASLAGALPLRDEDRRAIRCVAIRLRDGGTPYRSGGHGIALIGSP